MACRQTWQCCHLLGESEEKLSRPVWENRGRERRGGGSRLLSLARRLSWRHRQSETYLVPVRQELPLNRHGDSQGRGKLQWNLYVCSLSSFLTCTVLKELTLR